MNVTSLLPNRVRSFGEYHSSNLALWIGLGFFAVYIAAACMGAKQMAMVIALGMLVCIGVVTVRLPIAACAMWVLIAGCTPETWTSDFIPGSESISTAVVKLAGLALVAICIFRFGFVFDLLNPGFAFLLMFFMGLGHGFLPGLTLSDSIRSLIGAVAPFAFSFCRLPRRWSAAVIEATIWIPTLIMVFGLLLTAAGVRPFLAPDAEGSVRLAGPTLPAFLGGFAMIATYAALIELYRSGRNRYLYLMALNLVILIGTGARSPLACAVLVSGIAFLAIRSTSFTIRKRVLPMILALMALPVLIVLAATSNSIRLLTVLSGNAQGLSGRDIIWPFFEAAFARSPIFGWGLGAGKAVMDPDSLTVKLLGTTAAHNEYLRMGVEGGYIGITAVMLFMTLWTWRWTARIVRTDRIIVRLIMIGFAVQSITDNTLIAPTASILFTWVSAVFARGTAEADEVTDNVDSVAETSTQRPPQQA